ncbi:MAG: peptidase domain-containing ABC transporter [Rhodocyclaceae bacterium]|nr:peptidase domain-containing ABC transporter [Rhodocyclaceae bacterium]MCA6468553.1 peptidase domain-containing ABC transporter [Chitinophagaceae bacterium]MCA3047075.1 peptidase domain-containing ABC transporter [Rhodocyclaceae bacterium]MCA3049819.1 peptidase domain-containing ABC transporter [Rhodocyclaceae bacterium]MCA3054237.1 peptidase domain-containing ABC transporter [Rhodocyclaceae bacterium]
MFGRANRLPVILQTEAAECGLACLTMVAGYFGHRLTMREARASYSVGLRGLTLANLIDIADDLNLVARPLRLEIEHLSALSTPCVLHWGLNHFVVLKKANHRTRGITIHDPARGVVKIPADEVSKKFTGIALELSPNSRFTPKDQSPHIRLRDLVGETSGLLPSVVQILVLALALESLVLLAPFFMQIVVDQVVLTADRALLAVVATGFGLLLIIQTSVGLLRSWMVLYFTTTLKLQWLANVFVHLTSLPMTFFEKRHLGDIVNKFRSVETIQRTITNGFVEVVIDGILSLTMLVAMFAYSAMLGAVVIVSLLIHAALRIAILPRFRQTVEEQMVVTAKEQSLLLETIRTIQSIKLFGYEGGRRIQWQHAFTESTHLGVEAQQINLLLNAARALVSGAENIAVVSIGALLVVDGALTIGMLFAFLSYKTTFAQRTNYMLETLFEVGALRVQVDRLADIVLHEPEKIDGEAKHIALTPNGAVSIEVKDLRFRYSDTDPVIFDGLSFRVERGESVALVGPSGGGKTTAVKLMLGLLEPESGVILIDGIPLQSLGKKRYRQWAAAVMQEDQLLSGSIEDNICFFDTSPDREHMIYCAGLAGIKSEIEALAMGYQTLVGDLGTSLSGGQKQRIFLARALYKKPRVLFLDEATSHLDVPMERAVNAAVRELQITKVVVAHRPETIRSVERVIEISPIAQTREPEYSDAQARSVI